MRPPKINGPARSVSVEETVKRRKGEPADAPRAPVDVREAKQAIRGGLLEQLQQVTVLPVIAERPLPAEITPRPLPLLASATPTVQVSPTAEIVDLIREIALGRYTGDVPARDVIQAARLLCDFGVSKPTQSLDMRAVSVRVINPYSTEGDDDDVVELSPREPVPFMSIRREEEDD